jgi:hypothetical protein
MGDVKITLFWCGGGDGARRKIVTLLQGYLVLSTRPYDQYDMKMKTCSDEM